MLFRKLNQKEESEFRQWARNNYKPGEPIDQLWHPAVRLECEQMNLEVTQAQPFEPEDCHD